MSRAVEQADSLVAGTMFFELVAFFREDFRQPFHRSRYQGVGLLDGAARLIHEADLYIVPLPAKIVRFVAGKKWAGFLLHRGSRNGCKAVTCRAASIACRPCLCPPIGALGRPPLVLDTRYLVFSLPALAGSGQVRRSQLFIHFFS